MPVPSPVAASAASRGPRRRRRLLRAVSATAAVVVAAGAALAVPSGPARAFGWWPPHGDACGKTVFKSDGTPWQCTFDDEFSGNQLDTSKWVVNKTADTGFYVGRTCMTGDNVAVHNGTLELTAEDTGHYFACKKPWGAFLTRYTGAHIGTVGKFTQTYGRFEVRARYPRSGAGVHAGFWMYPNQSTYGAWPVSGEIDVSEWWSGSPHNALPTLHYRGSNTQKDSGWGCLVDDPTQWHTYSVDWQPTQMQFSIDGDVCFTDTWSPLWPQSAPQPFDQPFAMLLSMSVEQSLGPNGVTAQTAFPATYQVDYVKAWK